MNPRHHRHGHEPSPNRLYRDPFNGKLMGVCAGIADYFGFDVWPVRFAAILALIFFTLPTIIAYLLAGALLDRKPADMYATGEEEELWRDIRNRPGQTTRDARVRFHDLERRLRQIEAYVTSKEFNLNREIRDLDR